MREYNKCCQALAKLIADGDAPPNSIAPPTIDPRRVFDLDVDEEIWQDIGLDDGDGSALPGWLVDPNVRKGIRYMLQADRCAEEEARLKHERANMQEWIASEWAATSTSLEYTGVRSQFR